jgi:predicted transposase/invertase (TIGR01784 family)
MSALKLFLTEDMKRDAIYYQLFQRFPGLLFALLEHPPEQAKGYRFESVEVKEPTFRIDGVFLPPDDASRKVIYFGEFQFQSDQTLYDRLFAELHLYLHRNPGVYDDWYAVVIFPSRSLEPSNAAIHRSLLEGSQVQRFYLNEMGDPSQQPIGISLMQLTISTKKKMADQAKKLLERVEQEPTGLFSRQDVVELISTIAFYKFTDLSREEVEAMLGLELKESRIYQEVKEEVYQQSKEEGRLEREVEMLNITVPLLLKAGMTVEQIAEQLQVEVEAVHRATEVKS